MGKWESGIYIERGMTHGEWESGIYRERGMTHGEMGVWYI